MMGIIGEQQREISRVSKLLVLIDERTAGYSNESGTSNGNKKRQAVKNTGMNQAVGSRRGSRRPSLEADIIENTEEGEDDTSVDRSGDDGMKSLSQKRKESKNKNNKDSNSDRNEDEDLTSALQEGQNERQNEGMQEFDRDVVDFYESHAPLPTDDDAPTSVFSSSLPSDFISPSLSRMQSRMQSRAQSRRGSASNSSQINSEIKDLNMNEDTPDKNSDSININIDERNDNNDKKLPLDTNVEFSPEQQQENILQSENNMGSEKASKIPQNNDKFNQEQFDLLEERMNEQEAFTRELQFRIDEHKKALEIVPAAIKATFSDKKIPSEKNEKNDVSILLNLIDSNGGLQRVFDAISDLGFERSGMSEKAEVNVEGKLFKKVRSLSHQILKDVEGLAEAASAAAAAAGDYAEKANKSAVTASNAAVVATSAVETISESIGGIGSGNGGGSRGVIATATSISEEVEEREDESITRPVIASNIKTSVSLEVIQEETTEPSPDSENNENVLENVLQTTDVEGDQSKLTESTSPNINNNNERMNSLSGTVHESDLLPVDSVMNNKNDVEVQLDVDAGVKDLSGVVPVIMTPSISHKEEENSNKDRNSNRDSNRDSRSMSASVSEIESQSLNSSPSQLHSQEDKLKSQLNSKTQSPILLNGQSQSTTTTTTATSTSLSTPITTITTACASSSSSSPVSTSSYVSVSTNTSTPHTEILTNITENQKKSTENDKNDKKITEIQFDRTRIDSISRLPPSLTRAIQEQLDASDRNKADKKELNELRIELLSLQKDMVRHCDLNKMLSILPQNFSQNATVSGKNAIENGKLNENKSINENKSGNENGNGNENGSDGIRSQTNSNIDIDILPNQLKNVILYTIMNSNLLKNEIDTPVFSIENENEKNIFMQLQREKEKEKELFDFMIKESIEKLKSDLTEGVEFENERNKQIIQEMGKLRSDLYLEFSHLETQYNLLKEKEKLDSVERIKERKGSAWRPEVAKINDSVKKFTSDQEESLNQVRKKQKLLPLTLPHSLFSSTPLLPLYYTPPTLLLHPICRFYCRILFYFLFILYFDLHSFFVR